MQSVRSRSATRGKSFAGHSRKSGNKKHGGRKNSTTSAQNWSEETNLCQNGGPVPAVDYRQMFWQQQTGVPPHVQPHNGQRLFAAVSDPSVCGYSVPMAYAMEPVTVPPIYPLYQPLSRPNYRPFRGRPRRTILQNNHSVAPNSTLTNGYSSLQENRSGYSNPLAYQNGDYASLPPNANTDQSGNSAELNSEHRRYSDPGLGPADLIETGNSEDSDSGESGSSTTTVGKNNKLILSLIEQMNALRETNSQMFKELHETRTDLESVKSELAKLKRGGTTDYQPGMLSDIIRDMREANKVLDEAMITKVNAMIDEQNRQRTMEFEKLRDQLNKITEEKDENYRRIVQLEETVSTLKLNANNEGREEIAAFEEENLVLRRELQEARASRNMAENHVAKLEKLVDILRKKMNGATSSEETVAHIRELLSSGANRVPGAKISAEMAEEILRTTSLQDDFKVDILDERTSPETVRRHLNYDEDDEDDPLSSCDPDSGCLANSQGKSSIGANDSICSGNSLVGPVTDL